MEKILFLFSILFTLSLAAQNKPLILELKQKINKEKDTKKRIGHLYELGDQFDSKDSAMAYYKKAKALAIQSGNRSSEAKYASHAIVILNEEGKFQEALQLTIEALKIYRTLDDPRNLGVALLNVGNEYHYLSDLRSAAVHYLKAKTIFDSIQDLSSMRIVNTNLSSIFIEQKDYPKGINYGLRALEMGKKIGRWEDQVSSLYNLATAYQDIGRSDLALNYSQRLENIGIKYKDTLSIIDASLIKGLVYGKKEPTKSINFYNTALNLSKMAAVPVYELNSLAGRARVLIQEGQVDQALVDIKTGIQLGTQLEMPYETSEFHELASIAYEKLGDNNNALKHRKILDQLEKKLESTKYKNDILNLESRYRFEQNEAKLLRQSQDLRQKSLLNYFFIILVILLGIILYQAYRNYKNKQKINLRRIHELETMQKLLSTQNLLQGQEEERSRMAKELHDGLGGLLSGVKMNLSQMKKNSTITEEDNQVFERSVTLIDTSIKELRRVAHNLMPESIVKLGLEEAIKEFLFSLQHEKMSIIYLPYGLSQGLSRQMDISVYRIVQELLNNIIKHSEATQVLVQIRKEAERVSIDVEDNGVGFDVENAEKLKGLGLSSIRSRVDYWSGLLEFDSKEGEGTTVHIELINR